MLEGPQTALAGASRLVARPIDGRRAARAQGFATGLDTVMFLNPDYEGQVRLASEEQRACLRLAIDLARAGTEVWDALRPGPQSGRGRLFWLEVDGAGQPSRPHNLRRAVTATIEKKLAAAIDPKEEEDDSIGSNVRQLLRKYAPRVEHSGIAPLQFEWGSVFDDKARYRGAALSAIDAADTRIRRELENHYRAQIEQIRRSQEEGDAIYRTAQEDADRLRLSVGDGGLGAHSEHAVNAEIDKLALQRQEWRSAARRARDAVLAPAPGRPGPRRSDGPRRHRSRRPRALGGIRGRRERRAREGGRPSRRLAKPALDLDSGAVFGDRLPRQRGAVGRVGTRWRSWRGSR